MKIISLEFKDWRQFEGVQKIQFSHAKDKNLTVVYGTNGAAKTTILNAFLWTLYGPEQLTKDFENAQHLINNTVEDQAHSGTQLICSVTIEFLHRGYRYRVRRSQTVTKDETSQRPRLTLELTVTEPGGNTNPIRVANSDRKDEYAEIENELDEVLPSRLAHVFFFNGERFAERIATEQEAHDGETFAEAIRHVLRLKEYERASEHIKKSIETLNRGINDPETDARRQSKLDEIKKAESKLKELTSKHKELEERQKENRSAKLKIDKQLESDVILSEHAIKRGELETSHKETENHKKLAEIALARFLSKAVPSFLIGLQDKILTLASKHRERRHIPARFQEQFIIDLLHDDTCVCGRELSAGSPHRHKIELLKSVGGLPEVTERWNVLNSKVKALTGRLHETAKDYENQIKLIEGYEAKLHRLTIAIDKITGEMTRLGGENITVADVHQLNSRRKTLDDQISLDDQFLGRTEGDLQQIRSEKDGLEGELTGIEAVSAKGKLDQRRCRLLQAVRERINSDLEKKSNEIILELQSETTKIFRRLAAKNFSARFTPQLKLEMIEESEAFGRQVALGTGERQAANYAFVCAVSSLAAKQSDADEQDDGYPILVDAPFSVQEQQARLHIARELPKHTHQLVFLMLENTSEALREPDVSRFIGAEIVATSYTNNSEFNSQKIILHGRDYDYLKIDRSLPHPRTVLEQAVFPDS